tara:strand:- start:518 stop:685 length:168 start_codon:yes stop_codon:yes gene_type:complete
MEIKKKKKHNWMKGFIIPPPLTDSDHVSRERHSRIANYNANCTRGDYKISKGAVC